MLADFFKKFLAPFLMLWSGTEEPTAGKCNPVVIVHGLNDNAVKMDDLKQLIIKHRPGTEVHVPRLFESYSSLTNMWKQVQAFGEVIRNISDSSENGINIIGYSQGGLIARGVLQTFSGLKVNSFVALSSPLNGQFGDTDYVFFLPSEARSKLSYLFYTEQVQKYISIANYWKDPCKEEMYGYYSDLLAPLNNQSINPKHRSFTTEWRTNFINNIRTSLVMIGGPDDGVIDPWKSAHMGSYNCPNLTQVDVRQLKIYKDDVFGLRSLDELGRVHMYTFAGVEHIKWHGNETVFTQAILPWLH